MLNMEISVLECTGCGACVNVCEQDAIHMGETKDGFKYPIVNTEKCIRCGRCSKVCASRKEAAVDSLDSPVVYAIRSKNDKLRLHSTSGGIFSELAQCILEKEGNVAGAAYRSDWSVEHRMIQDIRSLESLRRSKYQQSDMNLLYREIKDVLEHQKKVLFCGTPCQVGGLRAFLGREYDDLYTCDFICRGVSSPKIFKKYIDDLREEYDSDIKYVWMKNKNNGWHSLTTAIGFQNGKEYVQNGLDDSYVQLYLKYNIGVRQSCYKCNFKADNDVADITLGDFWGLDDPILDDDLGTSVVICRTQKGRRLVNEILSNVIYQEKNIEDIKRGNPCLYRSIEKSILDVKTFYEILESEGYRRAIEWIANKSI